jgi:hypothetical protein
MVGRELVAERARVQLAVARDVHDVVGHALGVIGAEAGVTRSLPTPPNRGWATPSPASNGTRGAGWPRRGCARPCARSTSRGS